LGERLQVSRQHLDLLARHQPQHLLTLRRHFAWYFKGAPGATILRGRLNTCSTASDFAHLLDDYEHHAA
jgi:tRNA-dihydrouridine synthase